MNGRRIEEREQTVLKTVPKRRQLCHRGTFRVKMVPYGLWHYKLIHRLPSKQLLGLHRECCALRGLAWGKKHRTVQYVFRHPRSKLFAYHVLVMEEMRERGYTVDPLWRNPLYRGRRTPMDSPEDFGSDPGHYPEHDGEYLMECIENLRKKGVNLESGQAQSY